LKRNEGTITRVGIGNADVRVGGLLVRSVPVAGLDYSSLQIGDRVGLRWLGEKASIQSLLEYRESASGTPASVAVAGESGDVTIIQQTAEINIEDDYGGIASGIDFNFRGGLATSVEASGASVTWLHSAGDAGDLHTNYAEHDQQEAITALWNFAAKLMVSSANTLTSTSPDAVLEIKSDDTTHLQLSYDESNYATLTAESDGTLTLTPSGPAVQIASGDDFVSDGNLLWVDASENKVYINAGTPPDTEPTYRGALTVKPGAVTDKGLVIQGLENQNAYYLQILDHTGNDLILMSLDGDLESGNPGFVSGLTGWQIAHTGDAEFNDIWCRGEFHCSIFVADEMVSHNGTDIFRTSFKMAPAVSEGDNTLPAALDDSFTLVVQASWDTGLCYVANNDLLRLKFMARDEAGTGLDLWDLYLEVNGVPSSNSDRDLTEGNPGTYDVNCVWRKGGVATLAIPQGASGVVWCKVDQVSGYTGAILITSDLQYAPYLDIFTVDNTKTGSWGPSYDPPTITPRVRLGNLNGVLGLSEEWGIAASTDLSNASIDNYLILSDQQLTLKGVHQYWIDSAGNVRGELDPTAGDGDNLLWLGASESGARFKVYGDGDLWLSMLAISEDSGSFLFSQANGLALWGPHGEMSATTWASTRGQTAAITGAFHQVQGRWIGTRGLVIEAGCTNIVANPSAGVNVTDWWAIANGTRARSTAQYLYDGASFLLTTDTTGDGPIMYNTEAVTNPVQNTVYYFSAYVRAAAGTSGDTAQVIIRETGGATATELTIGTVTLSSTRWQRVWVTHTVLRADRTALRVDVRSLSTTAGDSFYADGLQLEVTRLTTVAIGSMNWCTWSGTAHNSTTTRVENTVQAPIGGTVDTSAGTVIVWFKINDLANPSGGVLWCLGNANSEFDGRVVADGSISYRINADVRCTSAAGSITANTEHCAVFTWNVAGDVSTLYLDGALVDTGTCGGGGWTAGTYLGIGYTPIVGTALNLGGTISEIATLSSVLTADQVAAMYALQRPLVDAGSTASPGIYILDGKFAIASSTSGTRLEMNSTRLAIGDGVTSSAGAGVWLGIDAGTPKFRLASAASGARVQIDPAGGYQAYTSGAQSVSIQPDGDVFFGSDISAVATTAIAIFANAQNYGSPAEAMEAGDILIGDNSVNRASILWDQSAGKLLFRGGSPRETQAYINTDGSIAAGGGAVNLNSGGLAFNDSNAHSSTCSWRNGSDIHGRIYVIRTEPPFANQRTLYMTTGASYEADSNIELFAFTNEAGYDTEVALSTSTNSNIGYIKLTTEDGVGTTITMLGDVDITGDLYCSGVLSTDQGTTKWELGGYTAGAPTPDGYLTVTINGAAYRVAVDKV